MATRLLGTCHQKQWRAPTNSCVYSAQSAGMERQRPKQPDTTTYENTGTNGTLCPPRRLDGMIAPVKLCGMHQRADTRVRPYVLIRSLFSEKKPRTRAFGALTLLWSERSDCRSETSLPPFGGQSATLLEPSVLIRSLFSEKKPRTHAFGGLTLLWSERSDSNRRQSRWQREALPLSYARICGGNYNASSARVKWWNRGNRARSPRDLNACILQRLSPSEALSPDCV